MHSFQKQFQNFVKKHDLLTENTSVLLAVSGGVDSMVMATCFLNAGFSFALAHANFKLRGADSDGDEAFVRDWAKKNNVVFHTKALVLGKGSTQLNARNARYEWFDFLCKKFGYDKIATAHHLNDSLETVLMNLTRGTGVAGLTGIKPNANRIIRPMLFADKASILDYAKKENIQWREDISNAKTDYDRNLIRHEVMPHLQQLNPSLLSTFESTSERIMYANNLLERQVREMKERYLSENKLATNWIKEPADLLILANILGEFGFSYAQSKEVFQALDHSGNTFSNANYQLLVDREAIFIQKIDEKTAFTPVVMEQEGSYEVGEYKIHISTVESYTFDESANVAYFDADQLAFPLIVRKWQDGDRFTPLGMKGSKKVSDYLINAKISLVEKEKTLVLLSGDEIVWLVGMRISEKFKIKKETKQFLRVCLEE